MYLNTACGPRTATGSKGRIVERDALGKPLRAVGTHMDITASKAIEQKLRDSEQRLNQAQRLAKIGDWEFDLETGEVIGSDVVYRIFEVDKERTKPSHEAFLSAVHSEDRYLIEQPRLTLKSIANRTRSLIAC